MYNKYKSSIKVVWLIEQYGFGIHFNGLNIEGVNSFWAIYYNIHNIKYTQVHVINYSLYSSCVKAGLD